MSETITKNAVWKATAVEVLTEISMPELRNLLRELSVERLRALRRLLIQVELNKERE